MLVTHGMRSDSTNFTMLFQIEDGPACVVFSLFLKKSFGQKILEIHSYRFENTHQQILYAKFNGNPTLPLKLINF